MFPNDDACYYHFVENEHRHYQQLLQKIFGGKHTLVTYDCKQSYKFLKEKVAKAAKIYAEQLREEVNEERKKLGKKEIEDDDDENRPQGGGTSEVTVSTTDPESGLFVKGEHERQFAYEAHTACDRKGFVLGVEVTAGNIHDSVAWDTLYDKLTEKLPQIEFVTMDAGYKTPWIAKKVLDDSRIPILPYTNHHYKKDTYRP